MANRPQGSLWHKWDLHVHTPLSVEQSYGGSNPEVWERFFKDIESLPPEIKVLGINDYIFVDGYEKVLKAKNSGRLANIDLILPVVELRIERFSGTGGNFKRINYHVIFSDEVSPVAIRNQFIGALSAEYKLSAEYASLDTQWNGVVTNIQTLQELGNWLVEHTPADKRNALPSPLELGFANLNYPLEEIRKRLNHHNFQSKYLTAVGKTEWSNMRWDGGGTATKKDVINRVDIVFTAAKTVEDAQKSIENLEKQEVNPRLLDCSDSHHFSDSDEHMRLGHCCSWLKADTTFRGLKLAIQNYNSRVYIGYEPDKVKHANNNKTKYIQSLNIAKKDDSTLPERWFNTELLFNHNLVAVIGNKGNAKSALTDILALCGNTKIQDFSFLNRDKFRDKQNKAADFEAEVTWESGFQKKVCLADDVDPHETELVKYVPQSFFEKVTNEVTASAGGDFDRELKKVIFSHIPESDRLSCESLDELLQENVILIQNSLRRFREQLYILNSEIVDIEKKTSKEELQQLTSKIEAQRQVIEAHETSQPQPVVPPEKDSPQAQQLENCRVSVEQLREQITAKTEQLNYCKRQKSMINQVTGELNQKFEELETYKQSIAQKLDKINVSIVIDDTIQIRVDTSVLQNLDKELEIKLQSLERELNTEISDSLIVQFEHKQEQMRQLQEELSSVDKAYQTYLQAQRNWEIKKQELIGKIDNIGSLEFLEEKFRFQRDELPEHLKCLKSQRQELTCNIYEQLSNLSQVYRNLAKPVQLSIDEHRLTQREYGLDFKVRLIMSDFSEKFLDFINQGRAGSFNGKEEGRARLKEICTQYEFDKSDDVIRFTETILDALHQDYRYNPPREVDLKNQLRRQTVESLYNFLFSLEFIMPEYSLQLDGKEMKQLSPGERGVLLLIFYLLIDKDDCPLLIDQPEENLDNQSIYNLLVPAVREAKKRRQIFLVTHNPNLAIVCDAEQIIHCNLDKDNGHHVKYESGAIENPIFNRRALDVLEGTRPAFDIRKGTYLSL